MVKVDESTALFYKMSKKNNGNTIGVMAEIDGIPSERYISSRIKKMIDKYPILSMCPVEHSQGWEWKAIVGVEEKKHLQKMEKKRYNGNNLHKYIDNIIAEDFAPDEPFWKIYLLSYTNDKKSYMIFKANHIYGDGHQVSHYLKTLTDGEELKTPIKEKKKNGWVHAFYSFIMAFLHLIYTLFFFKRREIEIDKLNIENNKVKFLHCNTWDIDEIKAIKNYYGVTINDLFFTIIAETIKNYCGEDVELSSLSMFNLRNLGTFAPTAESSLTLQNNIGFISLSSTNKRGSLEDRLKRNSKALSYFKDSSFIYLTIKLLKLICFFSVNWALKLLDGIGDQSRFAFSNFRAFTEKKYMDGHEIVNISNFVIPYKVGTFFTIVSYADKITLNVTYREPNIRDKKRFQHCLDNIYQIFKDKAIGSSQQISR